MFLCSYNIRLLTDYFYSCRSYQLRIFIGVFAEFMALEKVYN